MPSSRCRLPATGGRGATSIVRFAQSVALLAWRDVRLQTDWLFVLTDIQAMGRRHAGDLFVDRLQVRHVTAAHRVDHDLEFVGREHRQIIHGCVDGLYIQAALLRHHPIQLQLFRTDIHHGDLGPGGGIQRSLSSPTGGQTQQLAPADVTAQPPTAVKDLQWVGELLILGRAGKTLFAMSQLIPRSPIVRGSCFGWSVHDRSS